MMLLYSLFVLCVSAAPVIQLHRERVDRPMVIHPRGGESAPVVPLPSSKLKVPLSISGTPTAQLSAFYPNFKPAPPQKPVEKTPAQQFSDAVINSYSIDYTPPTQPKVYTVDPLQKEEMIWAHTARYSRPGHSQPGWYQDHLGLDADKSEEDFRRHQVAVMHDASLAEIQRLKADSMKKPSDADDEEEFVEISLGDGYGGWHP